MHRVAHWNHPLEIWRVYNKTARESARYIPGLYPSKPLNLHLSLDIPVLHPPAEYILASCPSTPCAVELAACNTFFEHSLKGTDVGALIRGIPAELKQTHSTSCHRATHTTDPMEAARIQRIYRYSLSMDIRPHIIVRPIHNGIADPLRLQFAALEQKGGYLHYRC